MFGMSEIFRNLVIRKGGGNESPGVPLSQAQPGQK